jgi:hypothetical protein
MIEPPPWRSLLRGKRDRDIKRADRGDWLPLVALLVLVIAALVGSVIWRHSPPW